MRGDRLSGRVAGSGRERETGLRHRATGSGDRFDGTERRAARVPRDVSLARVLRVVSGQPGAPTPRGRGHFGRDARARVRAGRRFGSSMRHDLPERHFGRMARREGRRGGSFRVPRSRGRRRVDQIEGRRERARGRGHIPAHLVHVRVAGLRRSVRGAGLRAGARAERTRAAQQQGRDRGRADLLPSGRLRAGRPGRAVPTPRVRARLTSSRAGTSRGASGRRDGSPSRTKGRGRRRWD